MDSFGESPSLHPIDAFFDGCRNGKTLLVAATLIEMQKERREKILKLQTTDESGQTYSPFLIAVRNEHLLLVRLLLTMFSIDPNDPAHVGKMNFDSYLVEGASPLWCAAAIGNFDLVEILVEHGAIVDKCTNTESTPLRAACYCGNIRIVKYLVGRNANISISNKYKNTCLMVSGYRGHIEVVEYLLDNGADPDMQAHCGNTALHFCVDGSQLDVAKLLVQKGASVNITNESGMTAPVYAAEGCCTDMVEYFLGLSSISTQDKIMLLELLGASFGNDKDTYDIEKTYHYFYLAMFMRNNENIPKTVQPLIPAYGRIECTTLEELDAISKDTDALHMESLVVRERILGPDCVELTHPIIYRGAVFADSLFFDKSIKLWQHALDMKQRNGRPAHADLFRFSEIFSQMVALKDEIDIDALVKVMKSCLLELRTTRESMESSKVLPDAELLALKSQLEGYLHVMLYLLNIVTKSAKSRSDSYKCGKVTYEFLKSDFRDRVGRTPLHMALDEMTPVDDFHVKDVCCFPNSDLAKLLLSCGADPNVICCKGNTPLHIIVQYAKPISDFSTLHNAITDLLHSGAHPDTRNKSDQCPLDLTTTGVAEIILKKESDWTLACFSARIIRKHNIAYVGKVPRTLEKFIEMH